jgi:hypothetical protein
MCNSFTCPYVSVDVDVDGDVVDVGKYSTHLVLNIWQVIRYHAGAINACLIRIGHNNKR